MAVNLNNSQSRSVKIDRYAEIISDLSTLLGTTQYYDYAPVLQRQIDQNTGIEIRGKFMTNDSTTNGELSYVTVLRNNSQAIPHDGLGLAWKKSITLDNNGYPTDYNVYLVDNDALHEEVYILNQMVAQDSGINNFLAAAKRKILVDTWYKFKITISTDYAIRVWIVEDTYDWTEFTETQYNTNGSNNTGYCLDRGANDVSAQRGTCFGLGLAHTYNSEWWYKDILISSIVDAYPMSLFKMEAPQAYFTNDSIGHIYYKGYGQWGATAPYENGLRLFVWNDNSSTWEQLGVNTAAYDSDINLKEIEYTISGLEDYLVNDLGTNYINVLATTEEADSTALLNTNYISLDNSFPSGIHQGNMLDIYVNAPTRIAEATVTVSALSNTVQINSTNGFNLPLHEIINVKDHSTQEALTRNTDYFLNNGTAGNVWSTRANPSLILSSAPATIDVTYTYYIDGAGMQNFINGDVVRNAGADNLIKIMPPTVISIESLYYRDGPAQDNLRTLLASWINNLGNDTTLEISDLYNYLYELGVTYIDLDSVIIRAKEYGRTGEISFNDVITSTYTIGDTSAFYSSVANLYGVTKL